jgi:hypothetical protein
MYNRFAMAILGTKACLTVKVIPERFGLGNALISLQKRSNSALL